MNDIEGPQYMYWHKLLLSIHDLVDLYPFLNHDLVYYLSIKIFDETHKFKLNIPEFPSPFLPVNECWLLYFFVKESSDLLKFIEMTPSLELNLLEENKVIATSVLKIKDFKNPSVPQKRFSFEVMAGRSFKCYVWVSLR